MWSQDPQQAHRCLPQGRQTIDGAFAILETVLKKNQLMSTALQQWFARFPVLPEQFSRGPVGGAGVLMEIATFLGNLAKEYESLTAATLHRGYPFLVDELLSRLGCASTVLQFILFTACRRRLGVQDDQLGNEMDTAFRKDQDSHRCSTSGRMGLAPITQPGQIEQRNAGLIAYFREIVTAATAARSSAQYSLRFPSVPGTVIPRPEWPYGPSDRKSIMMSLHQAHVRSPKRVTREGEKERLYQAVKTLPVGPTSLVPKNTMYQFRFEISEEQFALAATKSQACGNLLPVVEHYNGALRWRIRCCVAPASHEMPTEQQWATLDVSWPPNIFMTLNHQVLDVRRQPHNGKDLATEITDLVVCGTNVLNISCPDLRRESAQNRFLAVEMLETLSHSNVVKLIWSQGTIPEEETLATIKKRLASPTDDEVSFGEPDLSIDLADPFSATIFKLPARGVDCTHMECFDLETWLNTRPSKPPIKCPHRQARCTCPNTPEPSNPDKWRCPICSKDARPYSLRIDGFLLKVRAQLEAEGKLQTKSMRVRADGSWSVVLETDDDGGSDGEGSRARSASAAAASSAQTSLGRKGTTQPTSSTGPRREVEVIEID
ncbi:eabbef88-805f-4c5f-b6af-dd25334a38d9 [Thermothielavioides terrestris]|uniref:Eabbef88-805f-4c5f-b6af-dd25334a38d9 n=1 Tax=Thermothielavioides terrestris TaxID=2587410 RepID=A0A446BEB3_9PEZI|nr:eabbef88-805f-4c5f-b6af-dd25334a38d9 [Thermothielavioides terrestris]